jgi:hypothetical protein
VTHHIRIKSTYDIQIKEKMEKMSREEKKRSAMKRNHSWEDIDFGTAPRDRNKSVLQTYNDT